MCHISVIGTIELLLHGGSSALDYLYIATTYLEFYPFLKNPEANPPLAREICVLFLGSEGTSEAQIS
jgi:hypothetical protein